MSIKTPLDTILSNTTPHMTVAESVRLLKSIEICTSAGPIPSPFSYYFSFKPLSYIAFGLVLLLGATGTVAAAGYAKPGDVLFPIERATEQVRLALTSDTEKEALKNQFIEERFAELQTIVDEEKVMTRTATSSSVIIIHAKGESRVAYAVAVLATQLAEEADSKKREQFLHDLLDAVEGVQVDGRADTHLHLNTAHVTIDDSQSASDTAETHIVIKQKDGQVEINYNGHGGGSVHDNDGGPAAVVGTTSRTVKTEHDSSTQEKDTGKENDDQSFHFGGTPQPTTGAETLEKNSKDTIKFESKNKEHPLENQESGKAE